MMVCVMFFTVFMDCFVLGTVIFAVRFFGMVRIMVRAVNAFLCAAMAAAAVAVCHHGNSKAAG